MTGWQAMGCGGLVGCEFVSLKMNMALGKEVPNLNCSFQEIAGEVKEEPSTWAEQLPAKLTCGVGNRNQELFAASTTWLERSVCRG
jgi:hypothetical protein